MQVARVGGEDVVAIGREAHDSRVDGIGTLGSAEQYACSSPQAVIDGYDIDPGYQPGQWHLAPVATAPDLSHHPAAGEGVRPARRSRLMSATTSPPPCSTARKAPAPKIIIRPLHDHAVCAEGLGALDRPDHNGPLARPPGSLMHLLSADLAVFGRVGGQEVIKCLQTLIVLSFEP